MIRKKTKVLIPASIDRKLADLMDKLISNKSKYIEWLIYQDMSENNIEGIKNIFI